VPRSAGRGRLIELRMKRLARLVGEHHYALGDPRIARCHEGRNNNSRDEPPELADRRDPRRR
jgi:hypothetical protein